MKLLRYGPAGEEKSEPRQHDARVEVHEHVPQREVPVDVQRASRERPRDDEDQVAHLERPRHPGPEDQLDEQRHPVDRNQQEGEPQLDLGPERCEH